MAYLNRPDFTMLHFLHVRTSTLFTRPHSIAFPLLVQELVSCYGSDAVRFYFMKEVIFG
jgi:hypothetical protein